MSNNAPAKQGMITRDWRIPIAWLTLCAVWSSTWLAIKLGLHDLPPISYAGIRFVVAVIALFAVSIGRVSLLPKSKSDFIFIAFTGFLMFTVNYGLLFWGELHVSSGLAAVLQATIPISGMMFAHWMLRDEPLHPGKITGGLIALAGVAVICGRLFSFNGTVAFWAALGILLGATCASFTNVLLKARAIRIAPSMLAAWQMIFGTIPMLVYGLITEGNPLRFHWTALSIVCLLYLAIVGSSLTFLLLYWLLPRISSTKLNAIALITPPGAVAIGWLFGGERLPLIALLGGLMILLGVWMIFRRGKTVAPIRVETEVAGARP